MSEVIDDIPDEYLQPLLDQFITKARNMLAKIIVLETKADAIAATLQDHESRIVAIEGA